MSVSITLGTSSLEITANPSASNSKELIPRISICGVFPVKFQQRQFGDTDWTYPYDTITIVKIYVTDGNTLDVELQDISDQPTWNDGTLAGQQQAIEDIKNWIGSSSPIPPPPYAVFSADGVNRLTRISGLIYDKGDGPSPDSIIFGSYAAGLIPSGGDITITPNANFSLYFELYDPTLVIPDWTDGNVTIPYTGGANTTLGFKVRLKAGLMNTSYSGTLTITAPNTTPFILTVNGTVNFAYEPETIALLNAALILNDVTLYNIGRGGQVTGINYWNITNNHFLELKGQGVINTTYDLLSKIIAGYMYVGDSASTMKWNYKNTVNTDAGFRLSFFGGLVFDGDGCKGNGINGYANAHLIPDTHLLTDDVHIMQYNNILADGYQMGIFEGAAYLYMRNSAGIVDNGVNSNTNIGILASDTDPFTMLNRVVSTEYERYSNTTKTVHPSVSAFRSSLEFVFQALQVYGVGINNFVPTRTSYRTIGKGFTEPEANMLYDVVQAFMVDLQRDI